MQKQSTRTDSLLSFFEAERTYPNDAARAWYERLVGLDDHKTRLLIELEMLLHPGSHRELEQETPSQSTSPLRASAKSCSTSVA